MFTCDKCGAPHASEAAAAACEKKHLDFEVIRSTYGPYDKSTPIAVTLRFDGGRESNYSFQPGNDDY